MKNTLSTASSRTATFPDNASGVYVGGHTRLQVKNTASSNSE